MVIRTKLLPALLFTGCLSLQAQINDSIHTQKLSDVEISANAKPSVSLSTSPLQVITNEELLQEGIQSVSDAVRRFNGIVLKDYGGIGGLKTVAIRGMGAEHTAISYDGIMVSNTQSGQVDIGRYALDNISMVSLNIGQSDVIFQTAKAFASAGTLNLETAMPDFTNRNYKGHARITGGSFGLFNPMLDYAHKLSNTFSLSANGSWQRADGNYPFKQEDDKILTDRKRNNSDVDIFRTEVNLYSDFGKAGQLKAKVYYFDSERGLPGAVVKGNDYAAERLWDRNFFTQVTYNKSFNSKFSLKSQAKYDYTYTRYEDDQASMQTRNTYREQEAYLSNALLYSLNPNISFSFSEDLFYNKLKNKFSGYQQTG
ncbi:TonB-dependent receptor plug domain-containing protein, partial [Dysgonomonas sp. OttesenSCG-928-D17]|nr:TonB-dependent receptor plug domain-containing protein [Dysgonomonas sp. OttesenSCG-928-D17]